ncbi:MAG TPA: Rieske (2Fe-2S) protein [Paenirhodobacter sp.]
MTGDVKRERVLDAGAPEDFVEGKFRKALIGAQEIGIVRLGDGRYYAIRNVCPHAFGPLCQGMIEQQLVGEVGAPEIDPTRPVVACPWHGWEFDLRDGKCVSDPAWSARTFKVELRDGRVLVAY